MPADECQDDEAVLDVDEILNDKAIKDFVAFSGFFESMKTTDDSGINLESLGIAKLTLHMTEKNRKKFTLSEALIRSVVTRLKGTKNITDFSIRIALFLYFHSCPEPIWRFLCALCITVSSDYIKKVLKLWHASDELEKNLPRAKDIRIISADNCQVQNKVGSAGLRFGKRGVMMLMVQCIEYFLNIFTNSSLFGENSQEIPFTPLESRSAIASSMTEIKKAKALEEDEISSHSSLIVSKISVDSWDEHVEVRVFNEAYLDNSNLSQDALEASFATQNEALSQVDLLNTT